MRFHSMISLPAILFLALIMLASCGKQQKDVGDDITLTTTSDEAREYFEKGLDQFDLGEYQDARSWFDQALAADPKFAMAAAYRAMTSETAADWKKYYDIAENAREGISPGEDLIVQMLGTVVRDDPQKRYELAKDLVNTYPKSKRALMLLANEQQNMKEYTIARTTLSKVIDVDPSWAPPYRLLATSYLFDDPKDFDEAKAYMEKFVELKPNVSSSHIGLGDVYRARGELQKARDEYARAVELDPESYVALLKLGHAHTFLADYVAAREDFAKARDVATPDGRIAAENYGTLTWVYAGDYDASLSANDAVLVDIENLELPQDKRDEQYMYTYQQRALIAMHGGQMAVAEQAATDMATYARSVADMIDVPEVAKNVEAEILMLEGIVAAHMGEYARAMEKAEAIPAILENINNPHKLEGYHTVLGIIHLLEKNYEYAIEHLREADQQNVYVKYHLALALAGANKTDEARQLFEEVANYNFNSAYYAVVRNEAIARLK
jgi:tetratricopeptide (TPR) repeat protein